MSEGSDESGNDERVADVRAELARGMFDDAGGKNGPVAGAGGSLRGVLL